MARWPAVGRGPGQLMSGRDSGGAGHAELTGGAVGRSSTGAGLVVVVDDRARQRLVAARDSRRWRPETSTVARASATRGGGGLRRQRWPRRGQRSGGEDDGRAAVGCGQVGAAQADLGQVGRSGRMCPDLD
jgi:hypothetical protein